MGVTAIELAHGEAPYSDLAPMKVIMNILDKEPPQLKGVHWSKEFRDFVGACLHKNPSERLSVTNLFKQHKGFFDQAEDNKYLVK